jgi:hypothetical protein
LACGHVDHMLLPDELSFADVLVSQSRTRRTALDRHTLCANFEEDVMKTWNTPQATEIKMDAEISSYQDDGYDPIKDGPHFVQNEGAEVECSRAASRR